jgi:hypothetical protein
VATWPAVLGKLGLLSQLTPVVQLPLALFIHVQFSETTNDTCELLVVTVALVPGASPAPVIVGALENEPVMVKSAGVPDTNKGYVPGDKGVPPSANTVIELLVNVTLP